VANVVDVDVDVDVDTCAGMLAMWVLGLCVMA
jgi:hypothetical protein